jgi:hypothetical protein
VDEPEVIRIPLIVAAFVLLTAAKCSTPENEALMATVFGADVAAKTALPSQAIVETYSILVPSEEPSVGLVAAVEPDVVEPEPVVEPPAPPPCDNYTWRGHVYDCNGAWLYDL